MDDSPVYLSCGEDLMLRPVLPEDAPVLFQLVERNRSYLRQLAIGWMNPIKVRE